MLHPLRPGETLEKLIGSGLRIIQSRPGYRYSLDTVLLAHIASCLQGRSALELGLGNGAASLLLAKRRGDLKIVGIEIQETLAHQAQRSIALNGLEDRIRVVMADWDRVPFLLPPCSFDLALANPPFRSSGAGRFSPHPEVARAKHRPEGALESLLKASSWALKAKGQMALIYHCSGLPHLMASLRQARLEPKCLRLVHSFPDKEGEFALVLARKEGRPDLKVLPPLFLYQKPGSRKLSTELETIYHLFDEGGSREGQPS